MFLLLNCWYSPCPAGLSSYLSWIFYARICYYCQGVSWNLKFIKKVQNWYVRILSDNLVYRSNVFKRPTGTFAYRILNIHNEPVLKNILRIFEWSTNTSRSLTIFIVAPCTTFKKCTLIDTPFIFLINPYYFITFYKF